MKLSEVPLHNLKSTQNWLISSTGKAGTIKSVRTHAHGDGFRSVLEIDWVGVENRSQVIHPYQCTNISIKPKWTPAQVIMLSELQEESENPGTLYGVLQL